MKCLALLVTTFIFVASCSILASDFDRATFVGTLNLTHSTLREEVELFEGKPELIFVVPGKMCASHADAAIDLTIEGAGGRTIHRMVSLERLKWSHAQGSCNGYGYEPDGVPLAVEVKPGGDRVRVTAITQRGTIADVRLWFIYGGRVPGARIYQ